MTKVNRHDISSDGCNGSNSRSSSGRGNMGGDSDGCSGSNSRISSGSGSRGGVSSRYSCDMSTMALT